MKNTACVSGIFALCITLCFGLLSVKAQDDCQIWDSTNFPPANLPENQFGLPYNHLADGKPVTLRANCGLDIVRAQFGDGDAHTYIYDEVYVYVNDAWIQAGAQAAEGSTREGNWIIGNATALFADDAEGGPIATALRNKEPIFLSGFICHWAADERDWKCGCLTEVCDQPRWNLQQLNPE